MPFKAIELIIKNTKFFNIVIVFSVAIFLYICKCEKRPKFYIKALICIVVLRLVSLLFAYTCTNFRQEVFYHGILMVMIIVSFMICYKVNIWSMIFYFASGMMTWYLSDRTNLIISTIVSGLPKIAPFFVENTISHIIIYPSVIAIVYFVVYVLIVKRFRELEDLEIGAANSLFFSLVVFILTPIFYFASDLIANYDRVTYIILNLGEIVYYSSMLVMQLLLLRSIKEKSFFNTQQKLWLEEQKQYRLIKENIDAINIKCHDLKHQIHFLRESGQVDETYLNSIEQSINVYNSKVRTGNETLDIILTEKRLHCNSNNIQMTCMAEGEKMSFMEEMDIFSLFGNALDNAIEYENKIDVEKRFIHLSVRAVDKLLIIHIENYFEGELNFIDGIPQTTKVDKSYHGFGMKSIQKVVNKYKGNLSVSTEDNLYEINIMLPIPNNK